MGRASVLWSGALSLALTCLSVGCSALINPDPGRLGSSGDAGTNTDSGTDGCAGGCDDGVACTIDRCVADRCVSTPDNTACPGTDRCNPVLGCVPERCTRDAECDDGRVCTGTERCDLTATSGSGCLPGQPIVCDDGATCTNDVCDDATGACRFDVIAGACDDGVSCTRDECAPGVTGGPSGCINAPEDSACDTGFCFVGGRCNPQQGCMGGTEMECESDNECAVGMCSDDEQRCVFSPLDADGDGHGPSRTASGDRCGDDCDDGNPDIGPQADERCDGFDNDCDSRVDEGCATAPNDCGEAQEIVVDAAGRATVVGSFADLDDSYRRGDLCPPARGGRDAIYFIDLPPGTWDVKFETTNSQANTVLALSAECTQGGLAQACNDDANERLGTDSRVWLHRVPGPARFYVMVDAYDGNELGNYTLSVLRERAHDDACPTPSGTPMSIGGGGLVLGVQSNLVGTEFGSCSDFDATPEAIFILETQAGPLELRTLSPDFTPDLYVREGNCGGSEVGCETGGSLGGGSGGAFLRRNVDAGAYTVFLEGGPGTYALEYRPY